MMYNVVFKVGSDLSIFSILYTKDKSIKDFLEFALFKLKDMYYSQFNYMINCIDSISKNVDNQVVSIVGYFDNNLNYFSACQDYHFEFSDLLVFNDLKSKLNSKFHIGDLKRSNLKGGKNEIQKD